MTKGKINSRGIVVDYLCGPEEYRGGVLAPFELSDVSVFMRRSCEFNQQEVDAITYQHGLPLTHGDGSLYKISEMPAYYYEAKREDQMNRLLFLDLLLKKYWGRRIVGFDYMAVEEARELEKREKEKAVEAAVKEVKIIKITEIEEYPPCCDVLKVKFKS